MTGNGSDETGTDGGTRPVSMDVDIEEGRTVVVVTGDRDAAVVVRSASGERIYLPPEDFDRPPESSRRSPYDSPYQSAGSGGGVYQSPADDSPYQSAGTPEAVGLEPTADGFRIVHPEPVTDLRLLR